MNRELLPRRAAVLRHIHFSGRSRFVFGGDDGFGNGRRPVHGTEIPVTAKIGEALPVDPVRRPARRAIQGKTRDATGRVRVHAGGPARFIPAGDAVVINPPPLVAFIGTAPQAEADDLDGHVPVRSIYDHARTAAGPGRFGAAVG